MFVPLAPTCPLWDPGGPPATGDPAPGERFPAAGGLQYNDEPAVSTASAGWAAVAPEKRGQTTGSGLDPPLSGRAHRDCISGLEAPGPAKGGGRGDDAAAHCGAGTAEDAPIQNILRPPGDPTGQPTDQPRDGDYADPHASEESLRIMARQRGRRARRSAPSRIFLRAVPPKRADPTESG